MKQTQKRQRVQQYIHQKQQEIQQQFQDFRAQYELSGKTSVLLAQSECQGALTAYQDLLRMYGMHAASEGTDSATSGTTAAFGAAPVNRTDNLLPVLQAYCHAKHQEVEQKIDDCLSAYETSGDNKYLFLQRQYTGEVTVYQHVSAYIYGLEPEIDAVALEPSAEAPLSRRQRTTTPDLRFCHILVLESSVLIRKSVEMILDSEGFTVTTASDGVIGLDMARKIAPDVMLIDSNIARRSEEQLVFLLRHDRRLRKIPVIMLEGTGHAIGERLSAYLNIMASIKKPFQPDELLHAIAAVLPARKA